MYLVTSIFFSKFCGFLRISELSLLQAYANFPLSYFITVCTKTKTRITKKKSKKCEKYQPLQEVDKKLFLLIMKKVEMKKRYQFAIVKTFGHLIWKIFCQLDFK